MICLSDCSSESLAASSFSTFSPFQTPFLLLADSQDTINLKTKKTELDRKQNPDSWGSETSLKVKDSRGSVFQWGLGQTNIVFKKKNEHLRVFPTFRYQSKYLHNSGVSRVLILKEISIREPFTLGHYIPSYSS